MKLNRLLLDLDVETHGGDALKIEMPSGTLSSGDEGSDNGGDDAATIASAAGEKISINPTLTPKTNITPLETSKEPIGDIDDLMDDGVVTQARIDKTAKADEAKKVVSNAVKAKATLAEPAKQQLPATRDYAQFEEKSVPLLKKLNNEQFAEFERVHKLHRELLTKYEEASKGIVKLPDSYLEHPEAWQFDPAAAKYASAAEQATNSETHYTEQLIKIANGESWQDISGYDKNGKAILSAPIEAKDTTKADEVAIGKLINNASRYQSEFKAKLTGLRDSYKTRHSEINAGIKDHTTKAFPWLTDDKVQGETKVSIMQADGKEHQTTLKEVIEGFRKLIPRELGSSPLFEPLVGALTALTLSQELNRINGSKAKVQQQIAKDEQAAEPSLTGKTSTKAKKSSESDLVGNVDDLDDSD